jgi:L,D-transpeptidase catalytic domain
MMPLRNIAQLIAATATIFLVSCANHKPTTAAAAAAGLTKGEKFVNPFPAGTYDHFKAEPSYPKTFDVYKNEDLLSKANGENTSIKVDLSVQRAFLMNGEEVAMDYPICSGIPSRPTPTGTFYILEKVVDKRSNKFGKIIDSSGDVIVSDADSTIDSIPAGAKFEGASMRYWMRLTNDGVGHHIGNVRRRPASHACIRGPSATMPIVYSKVKVGTCVTVE